MTKKKDKAECSQKALESKRACNKDDLRTHLANERTFLSWCRTSISLVVFGFVVGRFEALIALGKQNVAINKEDIRMLTDLRLIGLFCFIMAGVIILVSGWRFLHIRKMVETNEVSLSSFPEIMVILSMVGIIGMVILLLVGSI